MRIKTLVLFTLISVGCNAQIGQVTEEQKREALELVNKFCTLFTQWCEGQRTMDTEIYSLCSGNDCSAYDDISTRKETTLRNYMLAIQKKYPKSLKIQISPAKISDAKLYYEPEMLTITQMYENLIPGNSATMGRVSHYSMTSYKNAYVVFSVVQTIQSLEQTTYRKIIYDVKSKRITAFVTGNGTYVSFLEAFDLMSKNDYKSAISKFDYAANNNRASLKNLCYRWAAELCVYLLDLENGLRFARLSGQKDMEYGFLALDAIWKGNITESLGYLEQAEKNMLLNNNEDIADIYSILGLLYGVPSEKQNVDKSVSYLKKAIQAGKIEAGYHLWLLAVQTDIKPKDLTLEEAIEKLFWSAEKGYPRSFLIVYLYYEYSENAEERNLAEQWLEASANYGDVFGMAYWGRMLIQKGDVAKGKEWLRKSLEGNGLESEINIYSGTIDWPTSREDIQILLDK